MLRRIAIEARLDEPFEEELAEGLVVAVQLAVGGDQGQRRVQGRRPAPESRTDALADEAVGVRRRLGLERDGRRQATVVEDDVEAQALTACWWTSAVVVAMVTWPWSW